MSQRRGGIIQMQVGGVTMDVKGNFTYNLGRPKREAIMGADGKIQGYKETGQPGFIEGEITDRGGLDLNELVTVDGKTVTLVLANGKSIVLRKAYYASEGTGNTEEGNIAVRYEGNAEEVS